MTRILIVDDDERFRRTLRLALDSHGYGVCEAAGGQDALDSFLANTPDLVLLDWHMPELNGLSTCQALRAKSAVPVIMVSANRSNSRGAALKAGANDYLAKPFSLEVLLSRIESALTR